MIIHVYESGEDIIFAEVEIGPTLILLGEGHSLSDCLRDLAGEVEEFEYESGYEVYP